jgi:hypothetical protein
MHPISTVLANVGRFFSFLIYTQSVGLLRRGISPSQGRYLHTERHKHRINNSSWIQTHDPSLRAGEEGSDPAATHNVCTVYTKLKSMLRNKLA